MTIHMPPMSCYGHIPNVEETERYVKTSITVTILLLFPTHFPCILFACSYLMLIISCLHSYFLLQTFFSFMHSLTVYT